MSRRRSILESVACCRIHNSHRFDGTGGLALCLTTKGQRSVADASCCCVNRDGIGDHVVVDALADAHAESLILPALHIAVERLGVVAIGLAAHLGGFLRGVNA
jgi:hypothetical protein